MGNDVIAERRREKDDVLLLVIFLTHFTIKIHVYFETIDFSFLNLSCVIIDPIIIKLAAI